MENNFIILIIMPVITDQEQLSAYRLKLAMVIAFSLAMAYLEAAVVVYLREIMYPEGFTLPLKEMARSLINIELYRELATVIMITSVAYIAGRKFWDRFGYFIIIFGVWDIFYYVWLKATIDWPSSLTEWDILFLIPLPWIGPVIAPVLISALMIVGGIAVTRLYIRGIAFKPNAACWILWIIATGVILYSFMYDTDATLHFQTPQPYLYSLLALGLMLYVAGYFAARRHTIVP